MCYHLFQNNQLTSYLGTPWLANHRRFGFSRGADITQLGTCFTKVDLPSFTDRVMAALRDVNEVKVLALMLLLRLAQLSSASVIPRLDEVADALKVIMKDIEVKDDTVKQDLERKGRSKSHRDHYGG